MSDINIKNSKITAYIGTYTKGESKGIYRAIIDQASGKFEEIELAGELKNPTYLAINKANTQIYAVIKEGENGGVASLSIDSITGKLDMLNFQVSQGNPPCHVILDMKDNYLFSANYHKGIIDVLPINKDGSLANTSASEAHEGSGPNKSRQEKPHVHYSTLTPDEKYLCVIDLGIDKLVIYTFDHGNLLKFNELNLKSGCGPRHMEFHPNGKFAYILTELSSEVIVLEYAEETCSFREIQYISTLPSDFIGENLGGAIHVSNDGGYLYTSNRGHDSIAIFIIDKTSGVLKLLCNISSEGKNPRDFNLDPTGRVLIVANQDSNNIAIFLINEKTGELSLTSPPAYIPTPACVKYFGN